MSKMSDLLKKSPNIHKGSDGSWGTDDHDGEILKGIAEVIKAIGSLLLGVTKK